MSNLSPSMTAPGMGEDPVAAYPPATTQTVPSIKREEEQSNHRFSDQTSAEQQGHVDSPRVKDSASPAAATASTSASSANRENPPAPLIFVDKVYPTMEDFVNDVKALAQAQWWSPRFQRQSPKLTQVVCNRHGFPVKKKDVEGEPIPKRRRDRKTIRCGCKVLFEARPVASIAADVASGSPQDTVHAGIEAATSASVRVTRIISEHNHQLSEQDYEICVRAIPKANTSIVIQSEPLDAAKAIASVGGPRSGGISVFIGTTRDTFESKSVERLDYECYVPMAKTEMYKIADTMKTKWGLHKVTMHHRTGICPVGEASVIIAAASAHRKQAMDAVQYGIDTLKATVPIWKKEVYTDGSTWKQNAECTFAPPRDDGAAAAVPQPAE
eukprot:m.40462 g.40462  ORF g.40462 m.40462 type:complete len:384 (-) comp14820_c0_seq2:1787-2938(-)